MTIAWGSLWQQHKNRLKIVWLMAAGITSVYCGTILPMRGFRGVSMQRASALAAFEESRHEHWFLPAAPAEGVLGGVPGGTYQLQRGVTTQIEDDSERKVVRTSSFTLIVEKPAETAEKIQQLAEQAGGFLVNWDANGSQEATSASLAIRVPAAKFAPARAGILKLAQRVENERVQSEDVTTRYVDEGARLRNLYAQEAQYLAILKLARTVKDTLEVSEKLNQVRGEIEQQQSEYRTLSKQVELVAISISLHKESDAQVFGLPWRPLYEAKFAARQGLEGLIDYSTSVMAFLCYLPAIALWMATILIGAATGWRIVRWAALRLRPVAGRTLAPNS